VQQAETRRVTVFHFYNALGHWQSRRRSFANSKRWSVVHIRSVNYWSVSLSLSLKR